MPNTDEPGQFQARSRDPMWWFENLAGREESYGVRALRRSFSGWEPPHIGLVLLFLPGERWVLSCPVGTDKISAVRFGRCLAILDIEVTPDFAAQWLKDNGQVVPRKLRESLRRPGPNLFDDPRVRRFYESTEEHTRYPNQRRREDGAARASHGIPQKPPIHVDLERLLIYVGNEPVALKNHTVAVFAEALVKARGDWVSFPKLAATNETLRRANQTRLVNALRQIPALKKRIEAEPGKGSRLR